jgi:hypothetical protein
MGIVLGFAERALPFFEKKIMGGINGKEESRRDNGQNGSK